MKKREVNRLNTKEGRRKRTSIGRGNNVRPLNKRKRKNWKRYRGQGG